MASSSYYRRDRGSRHSGDSIRRSRRQIADAPVTTAAHRGGSKFTKALLPRSMDKRCQLRARMFAGQRRESSMGRGEIAAARHGAVALERS